MQQTVRLVIPADRSMLLVIRLTTAGVAARASLTLDSIDDIKMAVEEACECLISYTGCNEIALEYGIYDGEMMISVQGNGCKCLQGSSFCETEVIKKILESMVDRVEMLQDDGKLHGFALTKVLTA